MAGTRRRRRSSGGRWLAVPAAAFVIAAVVSYQLYEHDQRNQQRLAFDCGTLTHLSASTAAERQQLEAAATGPTAVFLGDSYTQGVGLPNIKDDYAYVTADALHWRAVLNAVGGTGYVSQGPCHGQQLAARVPQVVAQQPQYVVIQAGLDDYRSSEATIERAAGQVYAHLRQGLPATRMLVVGPHPVPKVSDVGPIVKALRMEADKAHVAYIDTSSWPLTFEKDGIHLTVAGHRTYGLQLAEAIRHVGGVR